MNIRFESVVPHPLKEVSFQDNSIWNNNFSLNKEERVVLNATSGKGKTTFTHLLAGIRNDYDGNIILDNENTRSYSLEKWTLLRKSVLSFVFQDLQLFQDLTVNENLTLKNKLTQHKSETMLREELAFLGLENKWNEKVAHLSMGQQQRIAIIRSLAQPFQWIILDEPFSHLDNHNAQLALDLIEKNCTANQGGYIITTLDHDSALHPSKELFL